MKKLFLLSIILFILSFGFVGCSNFTESSTDDAIEIVVNLVDRFTEVYCGLPSTIRNNVIRNKVNEAADPNQIKVWCLGDSDPPIFNKMKSVDLIKPTFINANELLYVETILRYDKNRTLRIIIV